MSTLTQFSGGGIKSIQRGTISITSPNSTATATVTSVNTAKSLLTHLGQSGYYSASSTDGLGNVRISLTNATTITAAAGATPNVVSYTVSYELVEYN
jgi:hypothetical protein